VLAALLVAVPADCTAGQPDLDIKAATGVVLLQLEAFRRDDFDTAYTFASTTIRALFDRLAFENMVRSGYPEIARSVSAVVSRSALTPDGSVVLLVKIHGANGHRVEALYELVSEDGRWRINGVVTRPDAGESV
jgi:hypothetical protein